MAKLYDGQKLDFPIKFYSDYKGYITWIIGLIIFIIAMLYQAIFLTPEKFDFESYKIHIILITGNLVAMIGFIYAIRNRKPILIFTEKGLIYRNRIIEENEDVDIAWQEIDKIEINYGKYCIKGSIIITLKNPPLLSEPVNLFFYTGVGIFGNLINMKEFENIIRQIFIEKVTPIFHIEKIKFLDEYRKNSILKNSNLKNS